MQTDSAYNAMTQLSEAITTLQDSPYFHGSRKEDIDIYSADQLSRLDLMAGLTQGAVDRLLRLRVVLAQELHDRDHNRMYGEPYLDRERDDEEDDDVRTDRDLSEFERRVGC